MGVSDLVMMAPACEWFRTDGVFVLMRARRNRQGPGNRVRFERGGCE